ncbi:MAG: hypothetical protein AABY27_02630 [Pseudomonadota bacterium]
MNKNSCPLIFNVDGSAQRTFTVLAFRDFDLNLQCGRIIPMLFEREGGDPTCIYNGTPITNNGKYLNFPDNRFGTNSILEFLNCDNHSVIFQWDNQSCKALFDKYLDNIPTAVYCDY